jgi:hypothetical protein
LKKLFVLLLCGACTLAVAAVPAGASATGHAQIAKKCKKSKSAVAAKKKCKKKAPAPTSPNTTAPTGPTGPTAPPDSDGDGVPDSSDNCPGTSNGNQADADGDGHGDACDPCPTDSNPGSAGCPATIYEINDGTIPPGTHVVISDARVTAKMGNGSSIWVQVPNGSTGNVGTANAGLEVTTTGVTLTGVDVLQNVVIDGTAGTRSLAASSVTPTGGSGAVEYGSATPTGFAAETTGSSLDGQFVQINNTPFAPALSGFDNGNWNTSAGFVVGNRIIGTLPGCGSGSVLGLAGIGDLVGSDLVLLPRTNADITCLRLILDSEVCDTAGSGPIGSVSLGYPVANDTLVTIVSGDTGKLTVSNTTVPTGFSAASVFGTPVSDGNSVHVTATLNGISSTDQIDVVGAPTC